MIHLFPQRSQEWFDIKAGKVTSARVDDALAVLKKKEGEAARRKSLCNLIAAEICNGIYLGSSVVTPSMEHGIENEPIARTEYEQKTDNDVRLVGFVDHPTIPRAGASPDGLVNKDGVLEVKCPDTDTHIDYLRAGVVPEKYRNQCMWHIACAEREWCDFVSYDPRLKKRHALLIVRLYRDEDRIKKMNEGVLRFLEEVDELVARLESGDNYYIERLQASIALVQK